MPRLSIGIAGAGIGGLSAAAFLSADGHDVTVFDQFDRPRPVGSGLVIQPAGQNVLGAMGALPAAELSGARITRMLGHEAQSGRCVLDVWYDRARQQNTGLAIHRTSLFQALLDTATNAGAAICPGRTVSGVTDGPRRRLEFADGSASPPFDLVIDASGARSLLSPLKSRALPYGALWGTVPWPQETGLPADQLAQRYRRASRMLGVLPLGSLPGNPAPHAAIFWSLPAGGYDAWRSAPLEQWQDEATTLWPEFAPFIRQITAHEQMTMANYTHGTLRRTVDRGLVHIGDAAHRASPQLGQGANMALLDAHALALSLRRAPLDTALGRYARARRRHVNIYQWMSYLFTPQYQSDSRLLPILRDRVLAPLSRTPPVPAILSRLVCGTLVSPARGLSAQPRENSPDSAR